MSGPGLTRGKRSNPTRDEDEDEPTPAKRGKADQPRSAVADMEVDPPDLEDSEPKSGKGGKGGKSKGIFLSCVVRMNFASRYVAYVRLTCAGRNGRRT